MERAWTIAKGSTSVVVAIIDDGVDRLHPDLASRIGYNLVEVGGYPGIDDDLNGYTDDLAGWDFGDKDNDPSPSTTHGTHVAGIVGAAANNAIGVAGMDWNCWIFPVRVFPTVGSGASTADVIQGIYYAVNMGCDILNMSLGGPADSQWDVYQTALYWAYGNNVFVVAAMGNKNQGSLNMPAISDYVIAVGATDSSDNRWVWNDSSGSDFGNHIDIVAPGNQIYSTVPCPSCPVGLYDHKTGTSMAAPHVAGLAALILSVRPSLSVDSLYYYICAGAEDQVGIPQEDTPGWDPYFGWGRINAYRSLRLAMGLEPTGILEAQNEPLPAVFALNQNYPNPFNASTVIEFTLDRPGPATLDVYNILGQRIATPVDEPLTAGVHRIDWDGRDQSGRQVASGVYFYRLVAGDQVSTKRMVLLK